MGIPQILWVALMSLSLGIVASKHGQSYKYNIWYSLICILIQVGLLYWGGFFG